MKQISAAWNVIGLLAAALMALPALSRAQVPPDWALVVPGTSGAMLALDANNNTYATGSTSGPAMMVTKIDPAGVQLWQRTYSNAAVSTRSTWITTDISDNVIVTGTRQAANGLPEGWVVLKYDGQGTLLWQDAITSAQGSAARAVTDAAGNVYVLGLMASLTGSGLDLVVIKYGAGGAKLWTRALSAGMTGADAMAVTPAGNVVVTGRTNGAIMLAAVDSSGNQLTLRAIEATGNTSDLAVAPDGAIYVIGNGMNALNGGYLVVKHDAAFSQLWRNVYPARGPAMRGALDTAGNLVVTGAHDTNTGPLTVVLYDWMTIKIDANGTLLWSRLYGEYNAEVPYGVALGSDGALYITGEGRTGVVDPTGTYFLPSALTVKYAPDGTQLWAANVPATSISIFSQLRGVGIRTSADGGVMVISLLPQGLYRYPQSGLPNVPPVALAFAAPTSGAAPLTTVFSAASASDPDGLIASYLWNFGDGVTSSAVNPTHSYAAGIFSARLTVTDTLGASTTSAPITISSTAPPPVQPSSLTLAKSAVSGGKSTTATVQVSNSKGVTLTLASSNVAVASVPATIVIPAGVTSAKFTVRTSKVRRDTSVTISASANGATVSAPLTVRR